ncbi:hypothetical protein OG429_38140 [Streptomyces sp. NBC_00190]|uniref:hypothetical protein n=1 Tax=Streptomyces sp. NBC_00190 TaxID=2903634 RepID=UPI002E28CB15|nr:hypothetical protein [Streptomyces sp. NBC_00190]
MTATIASTLVLDQVSAAVRAGRHAEIVIEAHVIHAALGPVLDPLTVPVRHVVASAAGPGSRGMGWSRCALSSPV